MSRPALEAIFNDQVQFQSKDGVYLDGGVYVGATEFLPLRVLEDDDEAYKSEFARWLDEDWSPTQRATRTRILEETKCVQRYEDLCEAVQKSRVVPLVGAGMSAASGLPGWADFLRGVVSSVERDSAQLEALLEAGRFEDAAQVAAETAGTALLDEKIEHLLRLPKDAKAAGPICLLPEIFDDLLLTTNLDEILEAVYFPYLPGRLQSLKGKDISRYTTARGEGPLALKLHGDRTEPDTRVLLPAEYDASYGHAGAARQPLELLYQTQQVVFLGCSLVSDRTLGLLEELTASGAGMPRHFALLEVPGDDDVRSERELFLTARGVFPVWYRGPHDEAIYALLDGLREVVDDRGIK